MFIPLPPPRKKHRRPPFSDSKTIYEDDGYTPKTIYRPFPPGRLPPTGTARKRSLRQMVFIRGRWYEPKMLEFLEMYAQVGTISGACRRLNIVPRTHRRWLERSAQYRAMFANAEQRVKDRLYEAAYKMAVKGTKKKIYYKGDHVDTVIETHDALLAKMLDAEMPEKFRPARESGSGSGGPPQLNQQILVYLPDNGRSNAALPAPGVGSPVQIQPARPVRAQVVATTEKKS